jgi:TRAP-type C4-dicarboxylate transport system permease small subunit
MFDPERWNRWTFIVAYITMIATVSCLLVGIASYNHSNSDVNTNTGGIDI